MDMVKENYYEINEHNSNIKYAYTVRKGDIFWAELRHNNEVVGSEQGGLIRPVIILQNNFGNVKSKTTIVAKITSADHSKPVIAPNILIPADKSNGLLKDSVILLNQIETIDKSRLIEKMGTVSPEQLNEIHKRLLIVFGINVLYL